MKATRLLLAALALVVVSACSATNITGPDASADQTQVVRGTMGSGIG
jgi:outer membrane biogenesis lipoprotein LolB